MSRQQPVSAKVFAPTSTSSHPASDAAPELIGQTLEALPTGLVVVVILTVVLRRSMESLLSATAKLVALFTKNKQRAERALQVLRILRGQHDESEP